MFPAPDTVKKLDDLLWAKNHGQCLGRLRGRDDSFKDPILLKGHLVQETEGGNGRGNGPLRSSPKRAAVLEKQPAAIQFRYLQTMTEIGVEKNTTVIFPVPVDFFSGLQKLLGASGSPAPGKTA